MPFEISVNTSKVSAQVDKLVSNIDVVRQNMPPELVTWQVEDMKRKYPNMELPDASSAMTRIWPRSRRGQIVVRRRYSGRSSKSTTTTAHSRHPILRRELFEKLRVRMRTLLKGITL